MADSQISISDEKFEEWRPVVGYEQVYAVSNFGNVINRRRNRKLKPVPMPRGWFVVTLFANGKKRNRFIHNLVAEAFLGECPKDRQVNHIDGDKANNRLENLGYVTGFENREHARLTGLLPRGERHGRYTKPEKSARGERVNTAKLTETDVRNIRRLLDEGKSQTEIAEQYGIRQATVSKIKYRITWSHI